MKSSINSIPSNLTRIAGAIDKLPAALAHREPPTVAEPAPAAEPNPSPTHWEGLVRHLGRRGVAANEAPSTSDDEGDFSFVRSRAISRAVVAQRFVLARELNGLSQTEAALVLGFAKSGQLSLVEAGKKVPPLDLIVRASEAFHVSTDFLLGQVDEVERDQRLARRAAMRSFVGSAIRDLADTLADVGEQLVTAPAVDAQPLATAASRVAETFARFARKAGFEDVRGGATLAAAVRSMEEALEPVIRGLRRHAALDADLRARIAAAKLGSTSG